MSSNRVVKPVSFNLDKESDMLEHINKYDNFSSYIKSLVVKDMNYNDKLEDIQKSINDLKVLLENKKITEIESSINVKEDTKTNNVDLEQRSIIDNILNSNKHK